MLPLTPTLVHLQMYMHAHEPTHICMYTHACAYTQVPPPSDTAGCAAWFRHYCAPEMQGRGMFMDWACPTAGAVPCGYAPHSLQDSIPLSGCKAAPLPLSHTPHTHSTTWKTAYQSHAPSHTLCCCGIHCALSCTPRTPPSLCRSRSRSRSRGSNAVVLYVYSKLLYGKSLVTATFFELPRGAA